MNKIITLLACIGLALSATYFQIIPSLSFRKATENDIKNFTLSSQFELKDGSIQYNHKISPENPTGSILSKSLLNTPDFELHTVLRLNSSAENGKFFGIFFLVNYTESTFDWNSNFTGFGLIFLGEPTLFSKTGKLLVRLVKNLNNSTVEDLLYANKYVNASCEDNLIYQDKFRFMVRFKSGSLRTNFDNQEMPYQDCIRKPIFELEKQNFKVAFLSYEGKNFMTNKNNDIKNFDIKNDIEIFSIRIFNMNEKYRPRFTPSENFTLDYKKIPKFTNEEEFKKAIDQMTEITKKVDEFRKFKIETKEITQEKIKEYSVKIDQDYDELIKIIDIIELNLEINNKDYSFEKRLDKAVNYYRSIYDEMLQRGVDFNKTESFGKTLDDYEISYNYLVLIKNATEAVLNYKPESQDNKTKKEDL